MISSRCHQRNIPCLGARGVEIAGKRIVLKYSAILYESDCLCSHAACGQPSDNPSWFEEVAVFSPLQNTVGLPRRTGAALPFFLHRLPGRRPRKTRHQDGVGQESPPKLRRFNSGSGVLSPFGSNTD